MTKGVHRLIPTCVGSTFSTHAVVLPASAHPHVCGEHGRRIRFGKSERGSSPRVWGARVSSKNRRRLFRLIPTCVGSTYYAATWQKSPTAHPHVCGEHTMRDTWRSWKCGSSPRVWGARRAPYFPQPPFRLIPTCVGSTLSNASKVCAVQAHPHVCGEHG